MAVLEPSREQYKSYDSGENRRSKIRLNASIPPIFSNSKEKSTDAIVEVLNNRRYLKIENNTKRMRGISRDPKMKKVSNYIEQAGDSSLQAIYDNIVPHYKEEAPMAIKHLYPELDSVIGKVNVNVSKKEAAQMRVQPLEGRTYAQWIAINKRNYVTQWESAFRRIMAQNVTTNGFTSRDTQLISSIRKLLSTFENRVNTLFMDAMNNVSRQVVYDLQSFIWPDVQTGSPFEQ